MTSSAPFVPRISQRKILSYTGGRLGISAVPGSGKTHTLSALAARIIEDGRLGPGQEILIVTLVNSAVDNFSARIASLARAPRLIADLGYRVRTLHGLAHDIVRENPPLVGLDQRFTIVDEVASAALIRDAARTWAHINSDLREAYVSEELGEAAARQVANRHWPELVETISTSFIKAAKDRRLSPLALRGRLAGQPSSLSLANMGAEIYATYQDSLAYRGAVDFDDLIRLAAQMLEISPELLQRLRHRWPFVLEDEAQDSSRLQEQILGALVGDDGNWVRVGDPNQAIFETFTTANPELLRQFVSRHEGLPMPESGRCQPSIMALANYLIDWSMAEHPVEMVRSALSPPRITPAPQGDPQPNPPDDPSGILFISGRLTSEDEIKLVTTSLQGWLPTHRDWTVAVLTVTNDHAAKLVQELQRRGIECRELLRSTSPTRAAAGALSHVLECLADAASARKLAQAYRVWRRDWRPVQARQALLSRSIRVLEKLKHVEDFFGLPPVALTAVVAQALGEPEPPADQADELISELAAFREVIARWHAAVVLPIDQLILTIAQDVFTSSPDLALAHKLALVMAQLADENPHWRLPELTPHLNEIARNERKFIGFSADDAGFDPDAYRGVVVVSTMHKAKGLEWDRVYLMSVNNYDFPAALPTDVYFSEKWFLRDRLNLQAETLEQLSLVESSSAYGQYAEGRATQSARVNLAKERLRLLFVGITRARRELVVTWNTGRRGEAMPAVALGALQGWWAASLTSNQA